MSTQTSITVHDTDFSISITPSSVSTTTTSSASTLVNSILFDLTKPKMTSKENIKIPTPFTIDLLNTEKYRVVDLKHICRHYKLKKTGNKKDLIERIRNHLTTKKNEKTDTSYCKSTKYIVLIQAWWRRCLIQQYMNVHGYKDKCVNEYDYLTFDSLHEIPFSHFISIQEGSHHYGFDITSLYHLCQKSREYETPILNPYTRNELTNIHVRQMNKFIQYSKILGYTLDLEYTDLTNHMNSEQRFQNRIQRIFQTIDSHGYHSNAQWLLQLNMGHLMKFMRELYDIWFYRLNLTPQIRENVCPPIGNPFLHHYPLNPYLTDSLTHTSLLEHVVCVIENIIYKGRTREHRGFGVLYILMTFTLVSLEAANSLPWLYSSVI